MSTPFFSSHLFILKEGSPVCVFCTHERYHCTANCIEIVLSSGRSKCGAGATTRVSTSPSIAGVHAHVRMHGAKLLPPHAPSFSRRLPLPPNRALSPSASSHSRAWQDLVICAARGVPELINHPQEVCHVRLSLGEGCGEAVGSTRWQVWRVIV